MPIMHTILGYQLLGNPLDSFKSKAGGGKILKIVGDESDLAHLRDWAGKVEFLQGRLITIEPCIEQARDRNDLNEIPQLAKDIADIYAGVDQRIGVANVWWEIPPIMPSVDPIMRPDKVLSSWIGEWNATAAEEFQKRGLRSVCFGFATGYPQVKPYANAQQPDQWPPLYPGLKRLNKLGRQWTRIGVEEYVTGGQLIAGDNSNIGRGQHVYENHLKPNGWTDLIFRVIEGSFDVPGTHDIPGMTPQYFWDTMQKVDAVYAKLPYYDADALYAVVDPVGSNEAAFAITPSNNIERYGPSYLEIGQDYYRTNPPASFTYTPPVVTPPAPPPVTPPTPTTPPPSTWQQVVLSNQNFEGDTYIDVAQDALGMRRIPQGWALSWRTTQLPPHAELEQHPTHVAEGRQSARIYGEGQWDAWLWRTFKVPSHGRVRVSVKSLGTATDIPDTLSRPQDTLTRWIGLDAKGTAAPSDRVTPTGDGLTWSEPVDHSDVYQIQAVEVQAQGDTVTLLLRARHTGSSLRADVFWDAVVVEALPLDGQTPPPLVFPFRVQINTTSPYIYMRSTPDSTIESNKCGQAYVGKPFWVNGVSEDGKWWLLRGQDLYISRQLTKIL